MNLDDTPRFRSAIDRLFLPYAKEGENPKPSRDVYEIWWDALADIPIEIVEAAVRRYHLTERWRPTPAAFRDLIGANASPWPEPHEAWAMTPKSEAEAGWMCQATAAALGAALPLIEDGDSYGARSAFVEVSQRDIQRADLAGETPKWWISDASSGTYAMRLHQRLTLLEQHPERRPDLIQTTNQELQMLTGSERTGAGLQELSALTSKLKLTHAKDPAP